MVDDHYQRGLPTAIGRWTSGSSRHQKVECKGFGVLPGPSVSEEVLKRGVIYTLLTIAFPPHGSLRFRVMVETKSPLYILSYEIQDCHRYCIHPLIKLSSSQAVMIEISSSELSKPVSPTPTGSSVEFASSASNVSSPDLGKILSPISPGPSAHLTKLLYLVHRLAVRIACQMVRDRRPEARAYCEVE